MDSAVVEPRIRYTTTADGVRIAEALTLSVRTVERHIWNVYRKIGARGRADATAYALTRALA